MRSQIELYKIQHNDQLPNAAAVGMPLSLTGKTDQYGAAGGTLGPYLQKIPMNQFSDLATITLDGTLGDGSAGWEFNTTTGAFHADDTAAHAAL